MTFYNRVFTIDFINCLIWRKKTSFRSYANDLIETFENINIFPFINLTVTSRVVFPFIAIDLMLLHSFLLKSSFFIFNRSS